MKQDAPPTGSDLQRSAGGIVRRSECDPTGHAVYRIPRFGLTLLVLAALWGYVIALTGDLIGARWDQSSPGSSQRYADVWFIGGVYGYVLWIAWIVRSSTQGWWRLLTYGVVAAAVWVIHPRSGRPIEMTASDALGLVIASTLLGQWLPLPRWRLTRRWRSGDDAGDLVWRRTETGPRQFGILEIMIATASTGVLLAIARRVPLPDDMRVRYWLVAVFLWLGMSLLATSVYLAALRVGQLGRFVLIAISLLTKGALISTICLVEPNLGPSFNVAVRYALLLSGFVATTTLLAIMTAVQSLREFGSDR